MSGAQVAVVVPTTLLARQHFRTFTKRFEGLPVKVGQLSRMVTAKDMAETKRGMADGSVNIVIGTHALLAKGIEFADLGLLVVDEEQHFGVSHKEKLKALKADVHVLTLSATPIPRTLQLALTGVREMSPDRDAAGGPAGGAHLPDAVRRRGGARGDPARAVPRRPGVLRGAAGRGPGPHGGAAARHRAGSAHDRGAWPAGADRAGTGDDRVRRRQA